MLNTNKIAALFLTSAFLLLLPMASSVWADEHGRDDGRSHHGHNFHFHANSDLTLVSGMDNIDSRVLVDPAPDPMPEVVDQPAPVEDAAPAPSQIINSDVEGNIIVSVPNNAGGYTPIRIQRSGNGFVGPQGELYYPFPAISQLKAMYGI